MRTFVLFALFLSCLPGLAFAADQTVTITTEEAQTVVDAWEQTSMHVWSVYLIGLSTMAVTAVTLSLLFNLRTLSFGFLLAYGLVIVNTPYYVPEKFKIVFGFAIILLSCVGILWRFFVLGKPLWPAKKKGKIAP